MSFFSELKRRNVFRVGAAYLVVAWLLLQIMDTVGPIIGLSDAFARGVLFIVVIGFPIALILSWVYEMTPEGVHTQSKADTQSLKSSGKKLNAVIIAGLAMALMLVVIDAYVLDSSPLEIENPTAETSTIENVLEDDIIETATLEKSIAVLPFTNLSSDPEQEYFSDGLTEELLNKLAQVPDLLIAGRTSSFYYKDRNEDLRVIGEALGVSYVLEGSVRKAGDELRITAQLIQANNGFHLWSDTFDRELEDIFGIQDEIASAVTTALSVTLRAGEFNQPGMTQDIEAYDAYLKGLEYRGMDGSSEATILRRIDYLEQAVSLDPSFALAWLGLSEAYNAARNFLTPQQTTGFADLRDQARERAEILSPDMVQFKLDSISFEFINGNILLAEQMLQELIEQYGNSNDSLNRLYAAFLIGAGRLQDALIPSQRISRLEPRQTNGLLIHVLNALNRTEEAIEESKRQMSLNDNDAFFYAHIADSQALNENWDEAINASRNMVATRDYQIALLEYVQNQDAEGGIEAINMMLNDETAPPALRGRHLQPFASLLGEPELALEIFMEQPDAVWWFGMWFDYFSEMRQLPAFKQHMIDRGFANYWRTSGLWPDKCRPIGESDFECF